VPRQYQYPDVPRSEMVDFVPRTARRVLDVGCGSGGFGAALKQRIPGVVVWGIEANDEAARVAAGRLDRVAAGQFPSALRADASFDVVAFLDVLEHLGDPEAAVRDAKPYLSKGGVVIASLPNVGHYTVVVPLAVNGRWDYKDLGILDRTHLRFFTRATMVDLFESAGYVVERIEPISSQWPGRRSATWIALKLSGRPRRERMTTIQYGVVARPLPTAMP
jgi:2-polyprenyl-3-methyl-5-hydroxy-6-metoxy-1,4-benzoquinol methylase